jgi:hypothetical protein
MRIDFLDARRRANAESKRYKALLGGNGIQYDGGCEKEGSPWQGSNGLGCSGMGDDTDRAFSRVACARMVMRGECCRRPKCQQEAQQRYLFRNRPHTCCLESTALLIIPKRGPSGVRRCESVCTWAEGPFDVNPTILRERNRNGA